MKRKVDTKYLVTLAALCGVLLVMQLTGIGLIPLPGFKLTIMHIPVILGAILLGCRAGCVLGALFGLCSLWANTTAPGISSMFFSPFLSTTGLPGALKAIWVSVGCRVLFALIAGWLWKLLKKLRLNELLALPITGAVATVIHTVLVLGSICILFPAEYASINKTTVDALFALIGATVLSNGLIEAAAAAVLVALVGKALLHFMQRNQRRR